MKKKKNTKTNKSLQNYTEDKGYYISENPVRLRR